MDHESDIAKLFKDMAKYLPALVVTAIVGFINIPIVTRLFTPEIYGSYVLVLTSISILTIIVGWMNGAIVRFYSTYEHDSKLVEFYGTTIKLVFISIIAVVSVFGVGLFLSKGHISADIYSLMPVGLLMFLFTAFSGTLLSFLRAKRQVNWCTGFSIWQSVISFGAGISLIIIFHYGIEGLFWGQILSVAIALPLLWKVTVERLPLTMKGISIPLTSEMAKYGFPLVIGSLAVWIMNLSDRYILEFFQDSREVGIYSASYGISEKSLMLIVYLFHMVPGPIMWRIWTNKGKEASQEFMAKLTRYYLILCIPMVFGLSAIAMPVINLLTPAEYHEGYRIVPLVALSILIFGLSQRFGTGFCCYNKTHLATFCMITSGLLNLGLNFLLIPKYGYMAAAVTTLVSYIVYLI